MIDVKQAVEQAVRYMADLPGMGAVYGVQLEEVELSEDEAEWIITLSYTEAPGSPFIKYKIFRIEANTGRVRSMKIRTVK